ncbi:hypothetical protein PLESTM_001149600 [Pleodorina starrii]|nr:hypothetical protein PLESTM_001149600 [Pleodorina starrii]
MDNPASYILSFTKCARSCCSSGVCVTGWPGRTDDVECYSFVICRETKTLEQLDAKLGGAQQCLTMPLERYDFNLLLLDGELGGLGVHVEAPAEARAESALLKSATN